MVEKIRLTNYKRRKIYRNADGSVDEQILYPEEFEDDTPEPDEDDEEF